MVWDWLSRTLDGGVHQAPAGWIAWHGRLMVAGWGIAIPLGVLAARYFKVWPGPDWPRRLDDRRWWHAHRTLQTVGLVAASAGLWLAWEPARGGTPLGQWHGLIGWVVMLLGWAQVAGGALRGSKGGPTDPLGVSGDHYDMTRRRVVFEYTHKLLGSAAVALAAATVPTGLALAHAPRWMWLAIAIWWVVLTAAAVRLQRRGTCIDTYQAIWGPRPDLPGNRRRSAGVSPARVTGAADDDAVADRAGRHRAAAHPRAGGPAPALRRAADGEHRGGARGGIVGR